MRGNVIRGNSRAAPASARGTLHEPMDTLARTFGEQFSTPWIDRSHRMCHGPRLLYSYAMARPVEIEFGVLAADRTLWLEVFDNSGAV